MGQTLPVSKDTIHKVRDASRKLVRELGFMKPTIASTDLGPSALHTLLEIDLKGPQTAADLCQKLQLEKSSISRMLQKLVARGEITEIIDTQDSRKKRLKITTKGQKTVQIAHQHAEQQTQNALAYLPLDKQSTIEKGLTDYANSLEALRNKTSLAARGIDISSGYSPGAIGRVAYLFTRYFSKHYDFGQYFEAKVATEMAEFTSRLAHTGNQLWLAIQDDEVLGSIAIDSEDLQQANTAHLRWFIVDERLQGSGVGRRLVQEAIRFCDAQGIQEIHLWTVKGLDAASHLYKQFGFNIVEESLDQQWGKKTIEHKLVRKAFSQ